MTPNKFTEAPEFLQAFRAFSGLDHVTNVDLKSSGIKRKISGFYYTSQFIDLIKALGGVRAGATGSNIFKEISDIHKVEFPIIKLDPLERVGRTMQIEAYNFSILLLTDKFGAFTQGIREKLQIPTEGLKDWRAHKKWLVKTASVFHKMGMIRDKKDTGETYFILSCLNDLWLVENTDFEKKNYLKQNLVRQLVYDYIVFNEPFRSIEVLADSKPTSKASMIKFPSMDNPNAIFDENIELTFGVYHETTREELKKMLDEEWPKIEAYKNKLATRPGVSRVKDFELLKEKWGAYHLRLTKKSYKEIAIKLGKEESYVRKMVSEVRKEIKKMENGKLLPQG